MKDREKAYCYQPPFFCKIDLDLIKKEREAAPARRNIAQCSWCPRFVTIERVACLSGAFSAAQKGRAACSGKGPHSRGYSFPAEYMALPPRKYLERVKKRMTIGRLASKATAIIAPSSANFSSAKLTI